MYYVSFLHFEECHRHPVLLVFCDVLLDNVATRHSTKLPQYGAFGSESLSHSTITLTNSEPPPSSYTNDGVVTESSIMPSVSLQARNMWFKAYTLVRNPTIRPRPLEDDYDTLEELTTHTTEVEA